MSEIIPVHTGVSSSSLTTHEVVPAYATQSERVTRIAQAALVQRGVYTPKQITSPTSLTRKFWTYVPGFVENFAVNLLVMRGALVHWDPNRLKNGRLKRFEAIGAEQVLLKTPRGDQIHGCFFNVEKFYEVLKQMGLSLKEIEVRNKLRNLQDASPVTLHCDGVDIPGVKIPDIFTLEDLSELVEISSKNLACVFLAVETVLSSGEKKRSFSLVDRKSSLTIPQNAKIYIVPLYYKDQFIKSKVITINISNQFCEFLSFLSPQAIKKRGFLLTKKPEETKALFELLKIDKTKWTFEKVKGQEFLLPSRLVDVMCHLRHQPYDVNLTDLPAIDVKNTGVVLLSQNQTASFTQNQPEILRFLFEGVNVFAYDNAGKGLSKGYNTEQRMIDALEISYQYLREVQGFLDGQILAKGQCASGPGTSELAKNHPGIHVWIDQAPNSFQQMAMTETKKWIDDFLLLHSKFTQWIGNLGTTLMQKSKFLPYLISKTLPSYNVVKNLSINQGVQIYTIGVPLDGVGGDQLVPVEQSQAIARSMLADPERKNYLPMSGGEHISNWWDYRETHDRIIQLMVDLRLAKPVLTDHF